MKLRLLAWKRTRFPHNLFSNRGMRFYETCVHKRFLIYWEYYCHQPDHSCWSFALTPALRLTPNQPVDGLLSHGFRPNAHVLTTCGLRTRRHMVNISNGTLPEMFHSDTLPRLRSAGYYTLLST